MFQHLSFATIVSIAEDLSEQVKTLNSRIEEVDETIDVLREANARFFEENRQLQERITELEWEASKDS